MNDQTLLRTHGSARLDELPLDAGASPGAVSWAAIFAGATAAAALSLILLILGTGLGLSSVSPWTGRGASGAAFGLSTILWLTFTQIAAAGMGGYLAGRLRVRWAATQVDEVYFRDTAHGFLAWAVATLVTAAMLASAIGNIVGSGVQAGATLTGVAATAATATATAAGAAGMAGATSTDRAGSGYAVDALLRRVAMAPAAADASASSASGQGVGAMAAPASTTPAGSDGAGTAAEVTRIFANAVSTGALPADDKRYVAQLVAQRSGMTQADAEKKVDDAFNNIQAKAKETEAAARNAADSARKASAYAALWLFVSLLIGAFAASWAATYGGRQRDLA